MKNIFVISPIQMNIKNKIKLHFGCSMYHPRHEIQNNNKGIIVTPLYLISCTDNITELMNINDNKM
ncbi:MAG: hypothetical protein IJ848_00415 [Alphaproteobacteria bacterium]|nr:hypothetical protein [Alphaproteobacteria bacterium]